MRVLLIVDGVVGNIIEADSVERAQAIYPQALALDGAGVDAEIHDVWDGTRFVRALVPAAVPAPLEPIDFLRRFSGAQRIAIRAAAATDPVIADAMAMLDAAKSVHLDNDDTIAFTGYLAAVGLITSADAERILTP